MFVAPQTQYLSKDWELPATTVAAGIPNLSKHGRYILMLVPFSTPNSWSCHLV